MPLPQRSAAFLKALLRRRGLLAEPCAPEAGPPTSAAPAPPFDRAAIEAALLELVLRAGDAVRDAGDDAAFVAALDRVLGEGLGRALESMGEVVREVGVEEVADAIEAIRRDLPNLPPEALGLVLEALGVQEQIQPVYAQLLREIPPAELRARAAERDLDPFWYLTALPVVLAEILLAHERGFLASLLALHWIKRPTESGAPWQLTQAARLWRDGARATARFLASLRPELVSEGLVPRTDRLDLDGLAVARKQEDAWLAALVAAHPDDDRFPVHPDAAVHDAS